MIIDSHVHISLYEGNAKSLEDSFGLFLKEMKKNGVSGAIIIPDNIENSLSIVDFKKAVELIGDRKNLFLLGSPQIIQKGSSELKKYEELLKTRKILGLKFFPGHDPYFPTDERCLPYYEVCEKIGAPVIFHTGENSGDDSCIKWNDPIYIAEIARKYPKLKIVITHYYWPKMDYCYEITKNLPNIYFEIAAMADSEVVEKSGGIDKVKKILFKTILDRPDKVIFGTDWPMCKIEDHIKLIQSLHLDKTTESKVFYKNSEKLYGFNLNS